MGTRWENWEFEILSCICFFSDIILVHGCHHIDRLICSFISKLKLTTTLEWNTTIILEHKSCLLASNSSMYWDWGSKEMKKYSHICRWWRSLLASINLEQVLYEVKCHFAFILYHIEIPIYKSLIILMKKVFAFETRVLSFCLTA